MNLKSDINYNLLSLVGNTNYRSSTQIYAKRTFDAFDNLLGTHFKCLSPKNVITA